ncbi:DUF4476 domain-containing protein [uncultured Bacteroides sp.]|uniref:DUF4476 domain-containing protein n=1 Tax=uncultured Bacteroides sp. TaxID=162156 RepID=UPI0025F1A9BE|nr:DUF4476 domain-containing protein [uncultured Bacteroides sp.]
MDIIRRTIIWLAFAMELTSCSSLFYDLRSDVLQDIQKGMSKQEVSKLLGEPQFRRFDRDFDEWEYSKCISGNGYTTIIVSFEDGKVVGMDSFATYDNRPVQSVTVAPNEVVVSPPHTIYTKGMPEIEFQRFYDKVKSRPFKDDQFELMEIGASNRLNCNQCARLMSIFPFDDDKMQVLKIFAPRITDRENYEEILKVLDSLFKRDDAKKLLRIRN